jgi:hypothetical protein
MPVKRRTLKLRDVRITPRAVELFIEMCALRCTCPPKDPVRYWEHQRCAGCEEWWELHSQLLTESNCKPWEWPCIQNPLVARPKNAGREKWDEIARERWRELEAALAEAEADRADKLRSLKRDAGHR